MKTAKVDKERLDKLQKKAVANAIRENKALGLVYEIAEEGNLIEVRADGTKKVIGKSKFGTVKVQRRTFSLKK